MRPQPTDLYAHPRALLAEAVSVYGIHTVIDTCLALVEGNEDYEMLAMPLTFLGGASAAGQLERGELAIRGQSHWPRAWGARGLVYAWQPYAADGLTTALRDSHWRVREMAAKVVIRHHVDQAASSLVPLIDDPTSRVQIAALRASGALGGEQHRAAIEPLESGDRAVAVAREAALRELRRRLSRV